MRRLVFLCSLLGLLTSPLTAAETAPIAAKPLFRDPVYDGAADPVVIWNPSARRWWMFYTNRRANVPGLSGVAWVHGTPIGIAESADGAAWTYLGMADIELPPAIGGATPTLWAPDVLTAPDGTHHMFLTVVPGVFEDWQHPRTIVHLTSRDLRTWRNPQPLTLASDRVIDAAVHPLPGGGWRLWYNNERDHKSIYYADSPDLKTWTDKGKCAGVGERPGEGPYVFRWKGAYWMLVDLWKGLGVYRSDDLLNWTAQPADLLGMPGKGADDGVNGGHPGVVVNDDRAYLFYFTHPGRAGTIKPEDKPATELRRSSIQVTELVEKDGRLSCDRDRPVSMTLKPLLPMTSYPLPTTLTEHLVIPLWPEGVPPARRADAPASMGPLGPEKIEEGRISNISEPTLTVFLPAIDRPTGTAVIICPGGGYTRLSTEREGVQYARWLSTLGVTSFVLKYRQLEYGHPAPLQDVLRAVRIVRSRAAEFAIDPSRLGVMGSSAGGHLAASAGTLFDHPDGKTGGALDAISGRPDFLVLLYPVISMVDGVAHTGSRRALLGANPTPEMLALASLENQVTAATPPTLLIHTQEDQAVPIENSIRFFQALTRAKVPAEFYAFEHGLHGMGMKAEFGTASDWPKRAEEWFRHRGLLDIVKK